MSDDLREEEAYSLGVLAVIYGYPVAAMYRMRYSFCFDPNVPIRTPLNAFRHRRRLLDSSFRAVVSANNDTLYSSAWLDLSAGPVLLEMPEFGDRYHSFHLMDMYTNSFAVLHRRRPESPAVVALVGPGWDGDLPQGVARRDCPTNACWLIARILVDGPADVPAVNALQEACRLVPLYPDRPLATGPAPAWDPALPLRFFSCLNAALLENPPPAREAALLSVLRRIGVGPDAALDPESSDPAVARGLARALDTGHRIITEADSRPGRTINGWYLPPADLGEFGVDYLFRAEVAMKWTAPVPTSEAVYMLTECDSTGAPLDGAASYRLRFEADGLPPAESFWSLTLYRLPGRHFHANPLRRYALGDRTPGIRREADGSLEILIQRESPGPERESNWLPAPAGPFNLILRGYLPRPEFLRGEWTPPAVEALTGAAEG